MPGRLDPGEIAGRITSFPGFLTSPTQVSNLTAVAEDGEDVMQSIQLFELASKQAEWLSVRQQVVSTNIANANTPNFRAQDVTPFEAVLEASYTPMARTNPAHLVGGSLGSDQFEVKDEDLSNEIGRQESGNTVAVAGELSKSGEIKRQYELNTQLVKAFHNMMLTAIGK
jgi:flagellar basal-body rod protein FlgB